jgi:cell division protein FtsB
MEIAALEIARMSEEIDGLRAELTAETQRRMEAEAHLLSSEERMIELEMEVREECFQEMEKKMKDEMERWKVRWAGEMDRADEHVDRKLEILTRGIEVYDDEDKENHIDRTEMEEMEDENEKLRHQVAQLKRELQGRSPSKRSILGESRSGIAVPTVGDAGAAMQKLTLSGNESKSPVKKVRQLTTRKWDLVGEDEML